jgi:hypothetical protein
MRTLTLLLTISLAALAACGGKQPTGETTPPPTDTPPADVPQVQDQVFELPQFSITATVFQPEALSAPSMDFSIGGKRTIADQRKRYAKAKGDDKFVEGDALAIMLWQGPVIEQDKNRAEARELYKTLIAGGKAPEGTLIRAASVELLSNNEAGAATIYDEIVTRFATSSTAAINRAMKAYFQLRKGDDAGAAATIAAARPTRGDAANEPAEVSYVAAWLAFRKGDAPTAWKLIQSAVERWTTTGLPQLRRDVMIFASRANAPAGDAVGLLAAASKRDNPELTPLIVTLADAYRFAGRFDRRLEVYQSLAPKAAPAALAEIRFQESDAEYRLNHPDRAADRALEAWDAAASSKDLKDDVREALAKHLFNLASVDHVTFASGGLDRRYADAAKRLYAAYLEITPPRADAADAQSRSAMLDNAMAEDPNKSAGGVYNQDAIQRRVVARLEEVTACYEQVLQGSPQLTGTIKVNLDVAKGEVDSVTPDPAPGTDGLGAVSRCLVDRLDPWTFPSRHRDGRTVVVLSFSFAPKAATK